MENLSQEVVANFRSKLNSLTDQIEKLKKENSKKEKILENFLEERKKAESEVSDLQKKIRSIEDELESTESRLTEATMKLEEASKAADESERYRRMLEHKQAFESNRIDQLKSKMNEIGSNAAESKRKYEKTALELQEAEKRLETAEDRVEKADKTLKDLEDELHVVTGTLRTLENENSEATKHEEMMTKKINSLKNELIKTENRAIEAESIFKKKQEELSLLDDALEVEKRNYETVHQELNWAVSEIGDL